MSDSLRGKPKPSMQGVKHHNYKGGTSSERSLFAVSAANKELMRAVYKRDGYQCRRCGTGKKEPRSLHAHHLKDWATHPELRLELTNVITLCRKCHEWVHSLQNTSKEYLL